MTLLPLLLLLFVKPLPPAFRCTADAVDAPVNTSLLVEPHDTPHGHETLNLNVFVSVRDHQQGTLTLRWSCVQQQFP